MTEARVCTPLGGRRGLLGGDDVLFRELGGSHIVCAHCIVISWAESCTFYLFRMCDSENLWNRETNETQQKQQKIVFRKCFYHRGRGVKVMQGKAGTPASLAERQSLRSHCRCSEHQSHHPASHPMYKGFHSLRGEFKNRKYHISIGIFLGGGGVEVSLVSGLRRDPLTRMGVQPENHPTPVPSVQLGHIWFFIQWHFVDGYLCVLWHNIRINFPASTVIRYGSINHLWDRTASRPPFVTATFILKHRTAILHSQ